MSPKDPNYSRRSFLARTSIAVTSAGIAGLSCGLSQEKREPIDTNGKEILYRTLGKTGLRVPIVSMGVMNANNPEVVKQSYEAGVRLFDTALGYQRGRNEEMIGSVIDGLGVRDRVLIETKVPFPGGRGRSMGASERKEKFLSDFEGCLRRLKTDYVDMLAIHQPSVDEMNDAGVREALREAKKSGKAHFIGVSTHGGQAGVLDAAARSDFYDVVVAAFNFTMADDRNLLEAIRRASAAGIGIIAMKTQATGRRFRFSGGVNHTAALKWVLRHPEVATAIPGYTNFDHMKEDFSVAYGIDYAEDEKNFLEDKNIAIAMQFCRQCGECRPTCPKGVDIPALMRTHMYAACYTNFHQARAVLDEIPEHAGLRQCSSCTACDARCPRGITVDRNVEDLRVLYA